MKAERVMSRSLLCVLFASCLAAVPAGAAQSTTERPPVALQGPLTLDEAIARGLDTSHRLAELGARSEGAAAAVRGRKAAGRPQVAASVGYTRTNHVDEFGIPVPGASPRIIYPDIPNNYRARLDFQWPIYTFGRTDALERAAEAERVATTRDLAAARNDLKLEISRAFWAVVTARESVRVVQESLARMDAALADVRNRRDVGLVPPNDVLAVEAQRSRQRMLLVQAQNAREQALADLRRLTGLAPETPLEVAASLDAPPPTAVAAGDLVLEAQKNRPDRQAVQNRIASAAERQAAIQANRRPVVALGAGVDYARPNPRIFPRQADWRESWDASINVSWTLWDSGRVAADAAEAAAAQRALRERLSEIDSLIDVEVRQRRLDVETSKAAIEAASDAVRAAEEARRVVGDRFAAGVATSTEVLDAQVALLQAQLDRTQALANARLAEARLSRAVGR